MLRFEIAIKNRSCYIFLFFIFWDNLTILSINGLPGSNFPNFGFAAQTQFLIYIFLMLHITTAIKNRSSYICLFFSFRDNLTSLSRNGLPGSNFANFGFAPKTQFLIYIFFRVALCNCSQKPKSCICLFFRFWDNLTSFSRNGWAWSKIIRGKKRKKKFVGRDVTNFSPITL